MDHRYVSGQSSAPVVAVLGAVADDLRGPWRVRIDDERSYKLRLSSFLGEFYIECQQCQMLIDAKPIDYYIELLESNAGSKLMKVYLGSDGYSYVQKYFHELKAAGCGETCKPASVSLKAVL